jgi:hypothetical protein
MRWGAAKAKAGRAASMVEVCLPKPKEKPSTQTFSFALKKEKFKEAELYDGHYLLRSNLSDKEPEWLWQLYMLQRLGKSLPEQPPPKLSSPLKMELKPGAV